MNLFKRVLLSLFPEEMVNQQINPASMFVGLVHAKQFFSVINRKIIENYKLNLFDISLDPFEIKIGFGESPGIKVKDIDFYYSYCAVANLNGYRFFCPSNIGNSLTIAISLLTKEIFEKYDQQTFINFLFTVNLINYVFMSQLKKFPNVSKEEQYKRFIDLFFNFFTFITEQSGKKISAPELEIIKRDLLSNIQIFFGLFAIFRRTNEQFNSNGTLEKEYYQRLLHDELKKGNYKQIAGDFLDNYKEYTVNSTLLTTEKKLYNIILPADITIRYLFEGSDCHLIVSHLVAEIFDKKYLETIFMDFLKSEEKVDELILYITNFNHFKKSFFKGVQKVIHTKFKLGTDYKSDKEIDEFMSSIGEITNIDESKIPEKLKQESQLTERLINFYLTFLGGFWIARGDSFYLRFFKNGIIKELLQNEEISSLKQDALYYYGGLLYSYSKNVFYYKYAFENVRAGKDKINLPFKSTFKEVYSNMYILKLFDENFLATTLQDINPKDIRLFTKNKQIVDLFRHSCGSLISNIVTSDNEIIIQSIYSKIELLTGIRGMTTILKKHLNNYDIKNLKENIYNLDFRVRQKSLLLVEEFELSLSKKYSSNSILGILGTLRDSIFGLLLFISYCTNKDTSETRENKIEKLIKIYVNDIINVSDLYYEDFANLIEKLFSEYKDLLAIRVEIDDNKQFFNIISENRFSFYDSKKDVEIVSTISGEDIIRFRGFLKNITFYNKRYLIPKE